MIEYLIAKLKNEIKKNAGAYRSNVQECDARNDKQPDESWAPEMHSKLIIARLHNIYKL